MHKSVFGAKSLAEKRLGNRKRIIPNMTMFTENVGDIKVVFTL